MTKQRMTVDEFFEKLEAVGLEWRLVNNKRIRADHPYTCPISAVGPEGGGLDWWLAADSLRINERSASAIAAAADNRLTTSTRRRYRKRLLKACGLA